jgi:hypothetical protein
MNRHRKSHLVTINSNLLFFKRRPNFAGSQNTEELKLFFGNIESIVLHTKYFLYDDTEMAIALSTNTTMITIRL